MADLITRSDLIISAFEEEIQDLFFKIVVYFREHAIWVLGEPGKDKTPLGRLLAMIFSRYHGGVEATATVVILSSLLISKRRAPLP